ncbi:MAG: hypothetical protein V4591_00515 [Bdellovibrionota bacterium]
MMAPTIVDLRHRAWSLANKSIDALNSLNEVIFESSPNKPAKIENKPEDLSNISLQYIQDGIDIFNRQLSEINQKKDYLVSIQNKNKECLDALTQIME